MSYGRVGRYTLLTLLVTLVLGGLARSQPGSAPAVPGGALVPMQERKPPVQRIQELERTVKELESKLVLVNRRLVALENQATTHTHHIERLSPGMMHIGVVYAHMRNGTGGDMQLPVYLSPHSKSVEKTSKPD